MISMKLALLGDILLGIWIVILLWPFDCVAHSFHDGYALDGLYIECVFGDLSSVSLVRWAVIGLYRWLLKWMTSVVCESAMCRGRIGLSRARCRARSGLPVWSL